MKYHASIPLVAALVASVTGKPSMMESPTKAGPTAAALSMSAAPQAGASGGTVHTVTVGGAKPPTDPTGSPTPQLSFQPDNVMANVGDTVRFVFLQTNHSATQSTFANPCEAMPGGMDSGFLPNPSGDVATAPTFDVPVTAKEAIWMYCKQKSHCGKGMVFAINPTADKTMAMYKQAAIGQDGSALSSAGIQLPGGASAVASTVTVGTAAPSAPVSAAAASGSVAAGQGTTGSGQTCGCSCLCGAGSFPPGVGMNSFGGVGGMMT